ncbi:MAG: hypothetical protein JW982_10485, partial [Spirochaetes bacterium]|nr:hypothetical protein [Spirochaetota bacterium]
MKKIIFIISIFILISGCSAPQTKNSSVKGASSEPSVTFEGPYSLWGDQWAYRFSTVNKWVMQWEDAYKYE